MDAGGIRPRRLESTRYGIIRTERRPEVSMKVRPLYDYVLVKRIESEEVAPGGIVIPDTAKDRPQQGEVLAVGKGRLTKDGSLIPLEVKPGERVLFAKYAGNDVKIDGEDYLILREDEIFWVLEG